MYCSKDHSLWNGTEIAHFIEEEEKDGEGKQRKHYIANLCSTFT